MIGTSEHRGPSAKERSHAAGVLDRDLRWGAWEQRCPQIPHAVSYAFTDTCLWLPLIMEPSGDDSSGTEVILRSLARYRKK